MEMVRIGGACGFWGDSPYAYQQLLTSDISLDYIVGDYLSEVTLGLLGIRKKRDPTLGYIEDFPALFFSIAPLLKQKRTKLICNAGGLNPLKLLEVLNENHHGLNIACVYGDEVPNEGQSTLSNNVYFGAKGIVEALKRGAEVIITGRVADSSLVLAPLMNALNWEFKDFDLLSAGSLAGHLIECGAQVSGGNFSDWKEVQDFSKIGYPVAECFQDGRFVITKPAGSGGLVNELSVSEQLVYEIGDPQRYLLPDVTCDWSEVKVKELCENRVEVTNAKGFSPSNSYKKIETKLSHYKLDAYMTLIGQDNLEKAEVCFNALKKRFNLLLETPLLNSNYIVFGADSQLKQSSDSFEVLLKMSFSHQSKETLKRLSGEFAFLSTSMTPGFTQLIGGRPKVSPVLETKVSEVLKREMSISVSLKDEGFVFQDEHFDDQVLEKVKNAPDIKLDLEKDQDCFLYEVANARSGDKGNHANIGVIAKKTEFYPYIASELSVEKIIEHMGHLFDDLREQKIERYQLPEIKALNFLLLNSLGGGGMSSDRIDPQGKAYAQQLLRMKIKMPKSLLEK